MKSSEHAKILIVEDEGIIANNLASRLSMAGYDVTGIAESADDVMEKMRECAPELILMDIHIKGSMDGIETAAALRKRSDIPVIYLTAYSDQKTIDRAKLTGASGFLTKPIQYAALGHAIEMAISKHHADRNSRREPEGAWTVLDTIKEAVLVIGRDRGILSLNPAAEELTGWKDVDARGLDVSLILSRAAAKGGAEATDPRHVPTEAGSPWRLPGALLASNPSGEWFRIDAQTSTGAADDKVVGAVMQVGRENEAEHRQGDKLQAVGRLVAGVAHDFNSLLFVILGHTDELLRDASPGDPPFDALTMIRKAGETASVIAEQLLKFTRKESSRRAQVNVNEVIRAQDGLLRRLAGPAIRLHFNLDPDLGAISANPGQMQQLLTNLVTNARDAMPQGGQLSIETYVGEDPDRTDETFTVLRLTQSGTGMSRETADRLVQPFYTTEGAGRGLGMAIVQDIVVDLGGTIHVDSESGRGNSLTMSIPCAASTQSEPPRREEETVRETIAAANTPANQSATVLLIEDDPGVRRLVRDYLKDGGFGVLEASSGEEGLCIAHEHDGPIDLLITDVVMPNAGGLEIAHTLTETRPGMKTLFISGYAADFVDGERMINGEKVSPGARFLVKPFPRAELLRNVRELLGRGAELTARAHH